MVYDSFVYIPFGGEEYIFGRDTFFFRRAASTLIPMSTLNRSIRGIPTPSPTPSATLMVLSSLPFVAPGGVFERELGAGEVAVEFVSAAGAEA